MAANPPHAMSPAAWTRADPRFFWNRHLLEDFAAFRDSNPGIDEFVTPLMNGFVSAHTKINIGKGGHFDLLLISRRSRHRQGVRFYRRGIDTRGDVANFVETEQIILHDDGRISSHVQVRGSIPLMWDQTPTMRYMPKVAMNPTFSDNQVHLAATAHLRQLNDAYHGQVAAVNLVDTKGDQLMLGTAYKAAVDKAVAAGADVKYEWFDFHKECRKMQWHRLSLLMDRVRPQLEAQGLFQTGRDGHMVRRQRGAFRTNCMDNLDRTNVVQSLFARWALLQAFADRPLPAPPSVLDSGIESVEPVFKALWADNADAMSRLYSGTPALKTDFTRTGKRTMAGALQDGKNSLVRYVLNNLDDGRTQDAYDLFLGRYSPTSSGGKAGYVSERSPLRASRKDLTPGKFFMGLLLLNIAIIGGTVATLTATGSPAVFTAKASVGAFISCCVTGVLSFLQLKKGVGLNKALTCKPHFLPGGDVERDSRGGAA